MDKKNKRIIFITSHAESLVGFRWVLIKQLVDRGCKVYALAPNFNSSVCNLLKVLGVVPVKINLNRTGVNPLFDMLSVIGIFLIIKRIRPEVVLSYFIKPVIYGTLAAWMARVSKRIAMIEGLGYVFTYEAKELNFRSRFLRLVVTALYRVSLRLANTIVFLNPDDRAEFLGLGVVGENKSICIGGIGVDLNKWVLESIVLEPVTFLMVARLLREKGVYEYAEAAKYVKLKYPLVKFVLLGGLDENPGSIELEQVLAWNEQGVLTWHGHVPVAEHMRSASVYVLPSYREGVPVSTMEAMAMGRPIITTDVPGCRETVVDGVNGFMVPAKDSMRLAEKMIWFIENPSSIVAMGAASRKMAEEKFDVQKINAKLMQILLGDEDEKTA